MDSTAGTGQAGEGAEPGSEGEMVLNESDGGMAGSGTAGDSDALPDFSEEETLDEALESFEEAMESAAAEAQGQQQGGFPGAGQPAGQQGGEPGTSGADGAGQPPGGGTETAGAGQTGAGQGDAGQTAGGYPGSRYPGGSAGGSGVLTDAEQVAILDEQLNRGTGEFDDLILKERQIIRRTANGGSPTGEEEQAGGGGYGTGSSSGGFQVPPMAGGGGGGQGGPLPEPRSGDYDQEIPEQVAVYAPPADIPDGTDDDVVARQLREAAMREPDPQLREKLWDEYRKYKGIE